MKKILTLIVFTITTISFGQSIERQVIGASGSTLTDGATLSMSFTLGEVITHSLTNGTLIFNQGFQQGELSGALSIDNENVLNNIIMYPNPSNNAIYFSGKTSNISQINIFTISGEKIMSIKNNFKSIDISRFASAIYFVEISNSKGSIVKKLIKN